jgi:hypothetical protein
MSQNDWENLKDLLFGLFTMFIAWQNRQLGVQNKALEDKLEAHEVRARARTKMIVGQVDEECDDEEPAPPRPKKKPRGDE